MVHPSFLSGQWNAICDVCGIEYKSGQLRKRWDGLIVCEYDFEQRHPQDLIKIRAEKAIPDWVRPRPEDLFKPVCYIYESSGYADLGAADCMRADETSLSYETLYHVKFG